LDAAEEKIAQILVVSEPEAKTEDGLAVMDIQEELDDEGNVLSVLLFPIHLTGVVLTVLADAWVNGKDPEVASRNLNPKELLELGELLDDAEKIQKTKEGKAPEKSSKTPEEQAIAPTKKQPPSTPDSGEDDGTDHQEEGGGYVRVINDPVEPKEEDWVKSVPGESKEDAKLRREMLQYNMKEIGAVVAELNLEEDGDYYGYEDYSDDDGEGTEGTDTDDDDDNYGRRTRQAVADSYRREMEALEKRLTGKAPRPGPTAVPTRRQPTEPEPAGASKKPTNDKKGVRFAEELDIAPTPAAKPAVVMAQPDGVDFAPDVIDALPFLGKLLERQEISNAGPVAPAPIPVMPSVEKPKSKMSLFKKEKMASPPLRQVELPQEPVETQKQMSPVKEKMVPSSAISDSVMERAPGVPVVPVQPPSPTPKKISRFKAAKAAKKKREEEEEGPKGIMSDSVLERAPPTTPSKVHAPSDLDPTVHRQEVAMEFHKLRSKMIHRQGGFMPTEEEQAIVPLDQDGERVKISRFKAARLKGLDPKQ